MENGERVKGGVDKFRAEALEIHPQGQGSDMQGGIPITVQHGLLIVADVPSFIQQHLIG